MKGFFCVAAILLVLLLLVPAAMSSRHIPRPHSRHHGRHLQQYSSTSTSVVGVPTAKDEGVVGKPGQGVQYFYWEGRTTKGIRGPDTLQVAGSSLPDCSHACGSCTPCRLVMVSFVCASIAEAETCPMAYKCMCNNKSYPVP